MNAAPYLIRPALPEDAAGIAGLLHDIGWFKAYETHSAAQNTEAVQALLDELQTGPERSLMLVAQDGQHRIHGYCAVHWLPVAVLQGWEAYVSELFVAEAARGAGLLQAPATAQRPRYGQQPRMELWRWRHLRQWGHGRMEPWRVGARLPADQPG